VFVASPDLAYHAPMTEIVFLVEDAAEGGLIARALGHSIFTEADTYDELRKQVRDAVHVHFDDADRPAVIRLHYVKDEVLAA
jgi:hypothetical protein